MYQNVAGVTLWSNVLCDFLLSSQHFLDFVIFLKCACVPVIIRKDEGGEKEGIT